MFNSCLGYRKIDNQDKYIIHCNQKAEKRWLVMEKEFMCLGIKPSTFTLRSKYLYYNDKPVLSSNEGVNLTSGIHVRIIQGIGNDFLCGATEIGYDETTNRITEVVDNVLMITISKE